MKQKETRSVEAEGRTVQEAIGKALSTLGVPRSSVTVWVLAEENKGLFGMRGAKPARVKVRLKAENKT
ncbi:MAG: Jag N-terminal domain-containing protein [Candidatus Omnitrophica bacterium]|nr:Jag N-terminal domain-containing protein [Candidatus Omnitrophota bacterium]